MSDAAAKLSKIDWTVYGKIKSITKTTANSNINYYYDASGNRVVKDIMGRTGLVRTFYIRDAQGNTMGVYRSEGGNYYRDEQHLYGSSRTACGTGTMQYLQETAGSRCINPFLKEEI